MFPQPKYNRNTEPVNPRTNIRVLKYYKSFCVEKYLVSEKTRLNKKRTMNLSQFMKSGHFHIAQ